MHSYASPMLATPAVSQPAVATARHEDFSFLTVAFFLLTAVFLSTEHDPRVSLHESYTQSQEEMEAAAGGGNLLRRLAFFAIAGCGLYGLFTVTKRQAGELPQAGHKLQFTGPLGYILLVFLGWCTLSVLWSNEPGMTVRRLLVVYCFALGAAGVGRKLTTRQLAWLAMSMSSVMLTFGFCSELVMGTFRPWASDYRFSGSLHPNIQGLNLATLCLSSFCLWRAERNKPWLLLFFAAGFLFLFLTKSRTSCAGVLLALAPLWLLRANGPIQFTALCGGVGMLAMGACLSILSGYDLEGELGQAALLGRQEQAESLTGRLPIWTELAPFVEDQFWLGYGYDSFWLPTRIDQVSNELQWPIREAHSAYIDMILSVGIIGLLILLMAIACALYRAGERYLRSGEATYGYLFGILLFGLVNAGTESIMQMPLCVPFLVCCGLTQLALVPEKEVEPDNHEYVTNGVPA